eukprot:gene5580-5552_t
MILRHVRSDVSYWYARLDSTRAALPATTNPAMTKTTPHASMALAWGVRQRNAPVETASRANDDPSGTARECRGISPSPERRALPSDPPTTAPLAFAMGDIIEEVETMLMEDDGFDALMEEFFKANCPRWALDVDDPTQVEHKPEYMTMFTEFQAKIEGHIEKFLTGKGVTPEQFFELIKKAPPHLDAPAMP